MTRDGVIMKSISRANCKTFCHARMLLSGIHDFRQLQAGFPPRSVAGMTKLGVLQLAQQLFEMNTVR
jgi:hypothetical protein